jgi:hypothetical protein
MIPIKALVRDGSWLNCTAREGWTFRIRILKFEKLDYAGVDSPEKADPVQEGAVRWIMELEVVNTSKAHVFVTELTFNMRVVDGDGFRFEKDLDSHLCCFSAFAKRSGLDKLYFCSLMPKIKVRGAVLFRVPDEDTEYSLTIEDGTIQEA